MKRNSDLTAGNINKVLIFFALPYLLSCFLQTFYGLADLFIVGLFNPAKTTAAVSVGSQLMHMLTVMIAGIALGVTVNIGQALGAKNHDRAKAIVWTSVCFFACIGIVATVVLFIFSENLAGLMQTPQEAVPETVRYLKICFLGLPFIIAYNLIGSIFRGAGDSKSPLYFVIIACVVNIILDFVFVGYFKMGAAGAAVGTVAGQGFGVLAAAVKIKKSGLGFSVDLKNIRFEKQNLISIIKVGLPICLQDGFIQIAFLIVTVIANSRGLVASASVGVVEKIISFMFLVPSAFLSAISAVTAQNMGAKKPERARQALRLGLIITVGWGIICALYCQISPESLVYIFRKEPEIVAAGGEYLAAYSFDCIFAAIQFCFSGYFCGCKKSGISFFHNVVAIVLLRVPVAYFASLYFPETLFPMGLAAPLGSLLSSVICIIFYCYYKFGKKDIC